MNQHELFELECMNQQVVSSSCPATYGWVMGRCMSCVRQCAGKHAAGQHVMLLGSSVLGSSVLGNSVLGISGCNNGTDW